MNILHISASPRGRESDSHCLSEHVVGHLHRRRPGARVVQRLLSLHDLPHVDGDYAHALGGGDGAAGGASLARSDVLIAELEAADVLVIGTPMHNLTVPSALKAWLDHVVRVHRTMRLTPQGKVGTLADRPVYVAVSSGGLRTGPRARQPDFLEPYLRAVLPMIGLRDITVFSLEGTALGAQRAEAARVAAREAVDGWFAALPAPAGARVTGALHGE
ncbi:FMN-dependent NADH-azoreductase [uncultured Massilia sp.]|uniref:FMN-dependent NADH-azoreductase n=1 Tax=uncultured Massilia sp. TaxID=169973 RepID=UPI0025EA55CA|nr:NAD(P)H-dependent oxidoreductase [uncultured Massilia sp.]